MYVGIGQKVCCICFFSDHSWTRLHSIQRCFLMNIHDMFQAKNVLCFQTEKRRVNGVQAIKEELCVNSVVNVVFSFILSVSVCLSSCTVLCACKKPMNNCLCAHCKSMSVRMCQALVFMCCPMYMHEFRESMCVSVCECVCMIAWVSSVRFRQCLSAGIVGLTALSRHKVLYSAENCFPCWKNSPHQTDCPDLIRSSIDLGKNFKTPRREMLAAFCT